MFPPSMVFPPPVPLTDTPQPPTLVRANDGAKRRKISGSSEPRSETVRGFPFHDLKWNTNHTNTHRSRKAAEISPDRVPGIRSGIPVNERATRRVSYSISEKNPEKKKGIAADDVDRSLDNKSTAVDERGKIMIRIPNPKNCKDTAASSDFGAADLDAEENPRPDGQNLISGGDTDLDEFVPKTWNLRPRKPPPKRSNDRSGASRQDNKAQVMLASQTESSRPRNSADEKITGERKKKKPKLCISLTKMEIEEDIFALTGSKPSRRPKKRAKHVQKQLDGLFPGLWLGSITPDTYKVSEHPTKG